ncbi:MAG: hypothetical protein ACKVT2_11300 [Saprospiraceae bacterium]
MSSVSRLGDFGQSIRIFATPYLCAMFSKTFGYTLRATTYIAIHGKMEL